MAKKIIGIGLALVLLTGAIIFALWLSEGVTDPVLGGSWRLTAYDALPYNYGDKDYELVYTITPLIGNVLVTVYPADGSEWSFDDSIHTEGNRIEAGGGQGIWSLEGDILTIRFDDGHYESWTRASE